MQQSYTPSDKILEKYAELLVKFGTRNRNGSQLAKGSTIRFVVPEVAKPLYFHLQRAILKAGHNPLGRFEPSSDETYNFEKNFFDYAKKSQVEHLAEKYTRGLIDEIDATIAIIAETDPHKLKDVSSKKIMQRSLATKLAKDWMFEKVDAGQLNWTLALYGTDAAAAEAGMSTKAFWQQIIKACYLDSADPVKEWKRIDRTVSKTADKLTKLQIERVHVVGPDVDLTVGIGADRKWVAGGGNNIPSYEVFTSPNYRDVNGWIRFNQPLFRFGSKIEDIELTFTDGVVTQSKAGSNHGLLKDMLKVPGGNRVGEFSLTDARLSRITKFMAETLYDENVGGKYGNTHIALGSAYRDCHVAQGKKRSDKEWDKLGYNDSAIHVDIVSTTKRTVTATLTDGSEKMIYKDGQFTI